jgi:hypothetical protein
MIGIILGVQRSAFYANYQNEFGFFRVLTGKTGDSLLLDWSLHQYRNPNPLKADAYAS